MIPGECSEALQLKSALTFQVSFRVSYGARDEGSVRNVHKKRSLFASKYFFYYHKYHGWLHF